MDWHLLNQFISTTRQSIRTARSYSIRPKSGLGLDGRTVDGGVFYLPDTPAVTTPVGPCIAIAGNFNYSAGTKRQLLINRHIDNL